MGRFHSQVGLYLLVFLAMVTRIAPGQYYYVDPRNQYQRSPLEGALEGQAAIGKGQAAMIASQAAMLKATGEAITSNVKAAESLESARGRAIENSVKATANFYEKKKLYEAFRALTAGERPTKEDLLRYARVVLPLKPESNPAHAPDAIAWPEILSGESFVEARTHLDYVFTQRQLEPLSDQGELLKQARAAADQLREQLRKLVDEFSPGEYLAARRFIDGLELEVQTPPRVGRMAVK